MPEQHLLPLPRHFCPTLRQPKAFGFAVLRFLRLAAWASGRSWQGTARPRAATRTARTARRVEPAPRLRVRLSNRQSSMPRSFHAKASASIGGGRTIGACRARVNGPSPRWSGSLSTPLALVAIVAGHQVVCSATLRSLPMDANRFDAIAKDLTRSTSRRRTLGALLGGALTGLG